MKSNKRKLLFVILSIMILINSILIIPDIKEFYWGGSNYVFADFYCLSPLIGYSILGIIFLVYKFKDRLQKFAIPTVSLLILFWILSGRTIAIRSFNNSVEILSGWFYIPTSYVQKTCNLENDKVKFNFPSMWVMNVECSDVSEKVFTSPFIQKDIKKRLNE